MSTRDTAPVRSGEELNTAVLSDYLRGKVEGGEGPLELEQFPGGHSNLTYLVRLGGIEYVLRRAPLGPVAPKAHDMAREFRVLEKVHPVFAAAPRVFLLCEDLSVVGSVFFLMERRQGLVLRNAVPELFASNAGLLSRKFLECMVQLHSIDIRANGLDALGKPEGFLERQLRGWSDRWYRAQTEEMPQMDRVIQYLSSTMPVSGHPTLVHNDYKLDNVMWSPDREPEIRAVLDWEMATVGDPLADLGLTLCYWTLGTASAVDEGDGQVISDAAGWHSRDQFIESYAALTGRDLSRVGWYEALGYFKLAVIIQQIYVRYVRGQTRDERFRGFGVRVSNLVKAAAARIE